jgi:hypothetical protein
MKSRIHRYLAPVVVLSLSAVMAGCGDDGPYRGFGVKDGKAVFVQRGEDPGSQAVYVRNVGADAKTFKVVPPRADATTRAWTYAGDATQMFVGVATGAYPLADCDPATFVIMTPDGKYTHDASHVYYCGLLLKGADPKMFQILSPPYSKDAEHAFAGAAPIDVLDAATFEVVQPGDSENPFYYGGPMITPRDEGNPRTSIWGWARDSKAYYYADCRVKDLDRDSFKVLNTIYAKDRYRVYCAHDRQVVPFGADAKTFEASDRSGATGHDREHEYFLGKIAQPEK